MKIVIPTWTCSLCTGHRIGSVAAKHTLEVYLDYTVRIVYIITEPASMNRIWHHTLQCPFSAKIYKKLRKVRKKSTHYLQLTVSVIVWPNFDIIGCRSLSQQWTPWSSSSDLPPTGSTMAPNFYASPWSCTRCWARRQVPILGLFRCPIWTPDRVSWPVACVQCLVRG